MQSPLDAALDKLSEIQRQAVLWDQGSLLVLAGPGSGKTQVLTCRIARLLSESERDTFRILALTFTNKAADEMKERVSALAPGLEERTFVGTFHSFCGQVLRQHGVHIGIKSDFSIYALEEDRKAVFEDALQNAKTEIGDLTTDDVRYLPLIDRLKSRLIAPQEAERALAQYRDGPRVARAYAVYEAELRRLNAFDFSSLIFEANRLFHAIPAIAARYCRSHRYWLLDEFQDTNDAQYRLMQAMAGDDFKNVFAVADDDQIIYQWNGASFRQIQRFRGDFGAKLVQLPTNFRCPPAIVEAANRLVAYNVNRTKEKRPLLAGKTTLRFPAQEHIQLREFETDEDEAREIAAEIQARGRPNWSSIAVLGRTRALLDRMHRALQAQNVPAVIGQRRDEFLSAEFRWLIAFLAQIARPLDRRNAIVLIDSFGRMTGLELSSPELLAEAESSGRGYLSAWFDAANGQDADDRTRRILDASQIAISDTRIGKKVSEDIVAIFASDVEQSHGDGYEDLAEDVNAWREIIREITRHVGRGAPLDQLLQELQLRSKEPSPGPNTVTLMTVHGAKGREFDVVYVIGLAESIMPSFQACQKGDDSLEMEEERRNCFVAITRAKECLILSRAERYRGWLKEPSRFLIEMELSN